MSVAGIVLIKMYFFLRKNKIIFADVLILYPDLIVLNFKNQKRSGLCVMTVP